MKAGVDFVRKAGGAFFSGVLSFLEKEDLNKVSGLGWTVTS